MFLLFLMLQQLLQIDVDVSVVVLAVEDWFTAAILASSDVELELASVEDLVVSIEWTEENSGGLHCGVHLCSGIVSAVEIVLTCHDCVKKFSEFKLNYNFEVE